MSMNISLPHVGEYGIEVKNTGQIHVGIPTTKPLMAEVVDEALISVPLKIYSKALHGISKYLVVFLNDCTSLVLKIQFFINL